MALVLLLSVAVPAARAQDAEDTAAGLDAESETDAVRMSAAEATRLLAQALPADPVAGYALLQRQYRAAQVLDSRSRQIDIARQIVESTRGRPEAEGWIKTYLNAEFTWGSSGKALEACEPFITDSSLSAETRAVVALRQTYYAAQGGDRAVMLRLWSRAESLARPLLAAPGSANAPLALEHLQVRAEVERHTGNGAAAVATLRQSIGLGRRLLQAARARTGAGRESDVARAYGRLDGSFGMLVYSLVQQGRQQEAIDVAQANLALWRAGQLSEGLGARWNYRLATGLVSTQQYEPGLAAARLSDEMLGRAGAGPASHTRWLARQEIVRALMGLKRWPEADEAYHRFLADMAGDALARSRALDNRVLALLAAKNGRMEEALEVAERSHRYRLRLYGPNHPQTQEAAGVRAVVHLLRGETRAAMADYESLFAATLDTPGGWRDLDSRGLRGYVLGLAFDEFLSYVSERALKGERLDTDLSDRAFQLADRLSVGSTQRAITDSTARVLAATPELRALLEAEQTRRQALSLGFSELGDTLGEEDRLRRESRTDAFKALPEPERRAFAERQRQQREQVKTRQADVAAARTALDDARAAIARQFPAYADLVTPTTARPDQLRRLLGSGEALLVLHSTDSATLVWLLDADGRQTFSASRLTRAEVASRVADLRVMLDLSGSRTGSNAGSRPVLQPAAFHAFYRDLLGPQDAALRGVHTLIIASSGALASLPLATLVMDPPGAGAPAWLVRRMAVVQLPAPAALQALRRGPAPAAAPKALFGFGDPLFDLSRPAPAASAAAAPRPGQVSRSASRYDAEWGFRYAEVPPLPETRAELQALADVLGANAQTDLLLGPAATRRAVLAAPLQDRRVVAFATHGFMPGELPGVSKPALAMAADADEAESPLLELDDVLSLRLNAQWVLLSACNTAAGEQGGAAMSGLVRGFFFAGARSVLATHWAVETESAAALTVSTFKAQGAGRISRAEALRQAQLSMIDGTQGGGRWTHPYYWAPYALFGDPQR